MGRTPEVGQGGGDISVQVSGQLLLLAGALHHKCARAVIGCCAGVVVGRARVRAACRVNYATLRTEVMAERVYLGSAWPGKGNLKEYRVAAKTDAVSSFAPAALDSAELT